jgi:hypothetical protein
MSMSWKGLSEVHFLTSLSISKLHQQRMVGLQTNVARGVE